MEKEQFYYTALFKKISNQQKVLLNKGTSEQGITYVQSLVILYLDNMKGTFGDAHEVSQKDIENYLSLKGPTVTHIITRMEENGFIKRKRSRTDNRANQICLTDKGCEFVPVFFEVLHGVEDLMTEGLSTGEKSQLQMLLLKVMANLKKNKK